METAGFYHSALWFVLKACLSFFAVLWCLSIFRRLREDVDRLREPGLATEKQVIIFYWALTAGIIAYLIYFAYDTIISIGALRL